jgi:hypothetical protein
MKEFNGYHIPGHVILINKMTEKKTYIFLILKLVLMITFLDSCSSKMIIAEQNRSLPSAYTHSGKYVNHNGIGKRRDGIRKDNLKCHIPSNKKR